MSDSVAEVPLLKVNIVSADKTKKKCGRKAKKLEEEEKGLVTKLKRKYKKEVKGGKPEGEDGVLRRKNRCELCTYSTNNKVWASSKFLCFMTVFRLPCKGTQSWCTLRELLLLPLVTCVDSLRLRVAP